MARHTKKQTGTRKDYPHKLDLLRKGIFIKVKSFASRYKLKK